jgi:hypothetical protein
VTRTYERWSERIPAPVIYRIRRRETKNPNNSITKQEKGKLLEGKNYFSMVFWDSSEV